MEKYNCGAVEIQYDRSNQMLQIGQDQLQLGPKSAALLEYLAQRPGQLVSKDELLDSVWPDTVVCDAVLKNQIRKLRQLLSDDPHKPRFIQTVHRRGYRFIGQLSEPRPNSPQQQHQSDGSKVMIGRAFEIAQLHACWQRTLTGEQQLILISGDPGVGKSTLVDTWLADLKPGPEILYCKNNCLQQYAISGISLPILDALGKLCRGPQRERLLRLLVQYAPSWLKQLPWLHIDLESSQQRSKVEHTLGKPLLLQLAALLEALTQESPLLLVFEDLERADMTTLDLLTYLIQRQESARFCIVATTTTWDQHAQLSIGRLQRSFASPGRFSHIALEFFSPSELAEYLAQHSNSETSSNLADTLYRITEGHPGFLEYLLASAVLNPGSNAWAFALAERKIELPPLLVHALEDRRQELTPMARQVLEAISVASHSLPAHAIAALLEQDTLTIEDACEDLVRRGLWLERSSELFSELGSELILGECYRFSKTLYRRYFYERMPAAYRQHLQRRWEEYRNDLLPKHLFLPDTLDYPNKRLLTDTARKSKIEQIVAS